MDINAVICATAQDALKQVNSMKDYTNSEITKIIDECIHSERDRSILKRRLVDGIKYESIAEEFDLSVRHVKTIIYKREKEILTFL